MPAYEEELFGPVASILRVKDEAEAVRVANDTTLRSGRQRVDRRPRTWQPRCPAAAMWRGFVNAVVRSDVRLPFGGTKRSGFGRELAEHGIHEFMNIKSVYVA
jgi:succinate-semialdehyde dehydrogenase/glutarate-semialdehyde dehydrogenase